MIDDLEKLVVGLSAGGMSCGDWETLCHFAQGANFAVELGTNTGQTAIMLSCFAKKVMTIDVFENLFLIEDAAQREQYTNHFNVNRHYFIVIQDKLAFYHNILVQKSLTHEAAQWESDGSVDLLFIDADHSRAGVKRDYEAWLPKVRVGGFIAFHDVGEGCPGVWGFYNEELLVDPRIQLQEIKTVGQCWTKVFIKKP